VQTKRLTGRWVNGVRQTLLNLLERCLVLPTWHDAPSAVGGIQEHPATTVEDGARPSYINLIAAFHCQQSSLPQQDVRTYGAVNRLVPVIGGDEECIIGLQPFEEASKLTIDLLMHGDHRLGSGAAGPVGKRITQHLMGDFIDRRLVEQHEISRVTRQGLYRNLPKVACHAAGQGLEGRQRQARPFVQDTTAKKPANSGTEKWSEFLGPGLAWM